MLVDGNYIYVQPLMRAQVMIPGAVRIADNKSTHLQFYQKTSLPLDTELQLYFHNQQGRFCKAPFEITRMDATGDRPVAAITLLGQPTEDDRRENLRIAVPDQMLAVCVDNERSGSLVDISPAGIAILIDTAKKPIDSWIQVDITRGKQHAVGKMQVRSCMDQGDGFFRYGLKASQDAEDPMCRSLAKLYRELKKAADQSPDTEAQAQDRRNQRKHLRRDWPGSARVFIREGTNIRVLKVNTLDLSEGGLSFSTAQPILEGQAVLFERPGNAKSFCINGIVRSVRLMDRARYRIGLQFQGKPLMSIEIPEQIKSLMADEAAAA